MKQVIITIGTILFTTFLYGQGGVGINNSGNAPNTSAMLDVSSTNKGLLIPRVALTSTTDITTITNGNVTSLLVYNSATIADVVPGYYYWDGTVWKTIGGNDADADPTNEIQDLQLVGNNLTITNNGTPTTIDLSSYLDNTDNQNIDSVTLNGNNLTVYIEDGTSSAVDLSSLSDHDWYEVGTTASPDNITDDIFTQGNVGIGTISPTEELHVEGKAKITNKPLAVFEDSVVFRKANGLLTQMSMERFAQILVDSFNLCRCIDTQTVTFQYTGTDQQWAIPSNVSWIRIHAWGGGSETAGGYSVGDFAINSGPITSGSTLSIMVGEKGNYRNVGYGTVTPTTYGFGGSGQVYDNEGFSGAGLSGAFLGNSIILSSDIARALVIAGGSGGWYDNQAPGSWQPATCGNDPSGGGEVGLSGYNTTYPGGGGGGGGYSGGGPNGSTTHATGGLGGTGFVHSGSTNSNILNVLPVSIFPSSPPNTTLPFYIAPIGNGASVYQGLHGNGLVVIEYF